MADDETTDALVLLAQLVGATGAGSAVTLATGNPYLSLAGGAAGQVALQAAAERLVLRRQEKVASMLNRAAETSEQDAAVLLRSIGGNDALLELLAIAIEAAAQALSDAKLRTLGDLLARGVLAADDATLDVTYQLMRIWRDLEKPHLIVLDYMARRPNPNVTQSLPGPHWVRSYSIEHLRGASEVLRRRGQGLPHLADGMEALTAVLRGHGLIEDAPGDSIAWRDFVQRVIEGDGGLRKPPQDALQITQLGILVLEKYREAAGDMEAEHLPT